MSDEIPETADKAIRLWLAAIGFTLVLEGGAMMAEKGGSRFGIGLALVIAALPVHLTWVFWQRAKTRLTAGMLRELGAIATSPKWWFAVLLVLLAAFIFMPIIAIPRAPSLPFSRTALTTVPTFLRLQFNTYGEPAVEITKQNIDWVIQKYDETVKSDEHKRRICTENASPPLYLNAPSILTTQPSYNCAEETFPDYSDHHYIMLVLTFPTVIEPKEIKFNSHGARLPNWQTKSLTQNSAVIRFEGEFSPMILDIEVPN